MGKQIRKQKKSSIVAGGFFRFALYLIVAIAVIYIGKSAMISDMIFFISSLWIRKRKAEILL